VSDTQIQARPAELITRDTIFDYLEAFGLTEQLSRQEAEQFVEIAKAYQLNPFKREIYCIPYGQGEKRKLSIITGYESYLKRAERLGILAGWRAWTEGSFEVIEDVKEIPTKNGGIWKKTVRLPVGDLVAKVEIHRKDWEKPFLHEVYLEEYAQENEMWASKPRTMLKKVAIAQAFRMVFPDEFGGMPYTQDELPDYMTAERAPKVAEGKKVAPAHADAPTAQESPLEKKIYDARAELVALLASDQFDAKAREIAGRKIRVGQEKSEAYLDYLGTLLTEYRAMAKVLADEPANPEVPEQEELFADEGASAAFGTPGAD
jgi:phage recombination protein Bet